MSDRNGTERHAAVAAWHESADAGVPLTGTEVAERFGKSASWGRGVVREARAVLRHGGDNRQANGTAAPAPTDRSVPRSVPVPASVPRQDERHGRHVLDGAVTLAVALVAAAASYGHMTHVALMAGEPLWIARAFPLTVDGLVLAALRRGERGRGWLVLGLIASVAANVLAQFPDIAADAGPVVSAWPPLALYGTHRLLQHRLAPVER